MLSVAGIGWRQTNMKRIFLAAAAACRLSGCAGFRADQSRRYIEKRAQDEHCNASRAYKDSDADQNVIVVTYSKDAIVLVLIYEGWEWGKDDKILKADFGTDKATIIKKAKWEVMDKTTVRGVFEFNPSILDALGQVKRISIDFENDDDDDSTEFEAPRLGERWRFAKRTESNSGLAAGDRRKGKGLP
jgi:hypothetical protein